MTHRTLPTAWLVVFASLTAPSYAAEPEFNVGLITESRTYERVQLVESGGPNGVMPIRVSINRVTVALEGERITGEWTPLMSRWPGMLAKDFPLGTDVQAAIRGNELRLEHPDGTVVRARIVDRVNSEEDEDERD